MATLASIARLSPPEMLRLGRRSLVHTNASTWSSSWQTNHRISCHLPRCPKKNSSFHSSKQNNVKSGDSSSKAANTATEVPVSSASLGSTNVATGSPTMWQHFIGPKTMPERNTAQWYREMLLICTVFGITGSSTMLLVRPAVSEGLGIRGTFTDGPWSYRICSVVIMTPIYATLLVAVGTVFGRHAYFRHFSVKIFSRFGIPPEALDSTFHETKATFRKW